MSGLTGSTALLVEVGALRQALSEKDAQIERLSNTIRKTEVERDAADKVADNLRVEIERLKAQVKELSEAYQKAVGPIKPANELRKAAQ